MIDQAEHLAVVAGESDSEATDSDSSSVVHEVDESTEVNVGEGDITEGGEERSGDLKK